MHAATAHCQTAQMTPVNSTTPWNFLAYDLHLHMGEQELLPPRTLLKRRHIHDYGSLTSFSRVYVSFYQGSRACTYTNLESR